MLTLDKFFALSLFCVVLVAKPIYLGRYGHTYPIVEPDMYEEIQKKAKQIDRQQLQKDLNKTLARSFYADLSIKQCQKSRRYSKRFFYTLKEDVVILGTKIWKKGERVNLLQRLKMQGSMLFIDATKKKTLAWLKKVAKRKGMSIVVTKGDVRSVAKTVGDAARVKKAFEPFVKKLGIRCVPTLIHQEGDRMIFEEIGGR